MELNKKGTVFYWLPGIIIAAQFLLGFLFPDVWWSTHALVFLPTMMQLLIVGMVGLLMAWPFVSQKDLRQEIAGINGYVFIAIGMLLYGFLISSFPMSSDFYGEAYKLQDFLDKYATVIPPQAKADLFNFGIAPWDGQNTIFALVTYLAHYTGNTYKEAFQLFDLIFGCLFAFSWLLFVKRYLTDFYWKTVMSIGGLASPFCMNFFGHIEINAPVFFVNLSWLLLLLSYFKSPSKIGLVLLFLLQLVCIKLHAVGLLFTPAWLIAILYYHKENYSWAAKALTRKSIALLMLLPIFIAGAVLYFFVFKDYNDPRELTNVAMEYDRLFLPLISPEAPLDKYNMLSWNHIFDYWCELFLWSPLALFVIATIGLSFRKEIDWDEPEILAVGTTLLLFGALFFVTNPLLTMQMDWDLFSFPAVVFLVFSVVLLKRVEHIKMPVGTISFALALSVLSLPFFLVHTSDAMLSHRLERLGVRIYKTYYEWSKQTIFLGIGIGAGSAEDKFQRFDKVIKELEPYALKGNDKEYARMLQTKATHMLRKKAQTKEAQALLLEAKVYYPTLGNNTMLQMEAAFRLKEMKKAYSLSQELITLKEPTEQKALQIAVHCALEAALYDNALEHSKAYLDKFGQDSTMQSVKTRIENQDSVSTIKNLFAN